MMEIPLSSCGLRKCFRYHGACSFARCPTGDPLPAVSVKLLVHIQFALSQSIEMVTLRVWLDGIYLEMKKKKEQQGAHAIRSTVDVPILGLVPRGGDECVLATEKMIPFIFVST